MTAKTKKPAAKKPKPEPAKTTYFEEHGEVDTSLDLIHVPIDAIHENDYNPNEQDDRVYEAEKASIKRFGFVMPITVRPHEDIEGEFVIVDGAHRHRALVDLGYEGAVPCVPLGITRGEALVLTVALNETRGRPDNIQLSRVMNEALDLLGEGFNLGLPYDDDELAGLLKLADFDFDHFTGPVPKEADEWATIQVRVPESLVEVWETARGRIEAGAGSADDKHAEPIRNGLALEAILADFLAG